LGGDLTDYREKTWMFLAALSIILTSLVFFPHQGARQPGITRDKGGIVVRPVSVDVS